MRNYIELNGKSSNEITGLLIQQLPPISKPKMRTQVETIDGRAGDIITQLGFSAYDKTIEIGLYGDFDINEVISYFNSSGQVVFSNEPDKYYNYQIVDQIDYERLIRFRTAKVKMHVQPFKYPTEEEPLVGQYQYVTDTGSNLSLNNTANALFKKFDLKGNTSQVQYTGNQLIDFASPTSVKLTTTSFTNNVLSVVGSAGSYPNVTWDILDLVKNNSGKTLKIKFNNISVTGGVGGIVQLVVTNNGSTAYVGMVNRSGQVAASYNIPSDTSNLTRCDLTIYTSSSGSATAETITMTKPLVYFNNNDTYEPYVGGTASPNPSYPQNVNVVSGDNTITIANSDDTESQSYNVNLGTLELCKIGNYQDYIYKDNGSWYLHKEIGKVVLDGTNIPFTTKSASTTNDIWVTNNIFEINDYASGYSNHFKVYTTSLYGVNEIGIYFESKRIRCGFGANSSMTTLAIANQFLQDNNVEVLYPLKVATNTEITDTTLIEQLEEIKSANSYEGQTNISHDSNDAPFLVDVSALQSGTDELVVDNEGNIYSRPTLDLEGTGIVNVYLEGNQMFQVDLTDANEIVIDTDEMEAYNPTTQALMNRQVTGNYDNFKLNVGDNTLKFSGDLTKATVTNYVRWL